MKKLTLEYRILRLEKLLLEDIESDLDDMSNDIIKSNPTIDLDSSLNDNANTIVSKDKNLSMISWMNL